MPRPIVAEIRPHFLNHNIRRIREHLTEHGISPRIWAVIKANAYGHGIERVFGGLDAADGLAMLDLDEAILCRKLGWEKPILLLEGFFSVDDLDVLAHYQISTCVHNEFQLQCLEKNQLASPLDIYLKLNTGMNRLGFSGEIYHDAYYRVQQLQKEGKVKSLIKMTHFANADSSKGIEQAMHCFYTHTHDLPGPSSVCNSAATWRYPDAACDAVRPGIIIYGASPFAEYSAKEMGLLPVMTLKSSIISVQRIRAGEQVGYGGTYTATQDMVIGIVACGYADGYPRHAPSGTPVLVKHDMATLVGRVSMDMLAIDISALAHVAVGDPVVLWGEGGPSVDEVAQCAGTIGYELLCALAPRVPVVVMDSEGQKP